MSVNIRDFPDAGILYAIEDNIGEDGYASVQDIGDALGQRDLRGLATRLAWMKRYGMALKHPREPGRWRVASAAKRSPALQRGGSIDLIQAAARRAGPEFDMVRRTVEHYRFNRNGGRR